MILVPVNIAIIVIVTEKFKNEMLEELQKALEEVNRLIKQVKSRKMVKISEVFRGTMIEHISEQAKQQAEEKAKEDKEKPQERKLDYEDSYKLEYLRILKDRLEKEINNVKNWEEGEEVLFRTITGMYSLQPGVSINFKEAFPTLFVRIKDWVVVSVSGS